MPPIAKHLQAARRSNRVFDKTGQYTLTVRVLTPNPCDYIIRYRDATDLFGSGWISTVGQWAFGLIFAAHIIEFIVHRSLFEKAEGSMGHHFVQTMIYGLFHWTPIKQRLESEEPG